ncbi:hypothetical protein [Leifsonia sp. Leaf336]|uniref:hypothetical protein n=1 Tax=Leifsonia sp. Leaf336 TaxID=1736341 RepID=UPI000ACC7A27|nr:hypothetical protein [Leifsonia sp. Leaf336]
MGELDDLVNTVEVELANDLDVARWLVPLREQIQRARRPGAPAELSSGPLRQSHRALEAASERLSRFERQLEHVVELLPVLAGEWPERERQFDEAFATDLKTGVGLWLSDWWLAVGLGRLDAMDRLVHQLGRTPGAGFLRDHAEVIRSGLASRNWEFVAMELERVLDDRALDGETRLDDRARARLEALAARMRLLQFEAGGASAEADRNVGSVDPSPHLERASGFGFHATALALEARWHRVRGRAEESKNLLSGARQAEPLNLDVISELIVEDRSGGDRDRAERGAARAIAAIPLLTEVEPRIDALFYAAPVELWIAAAQRAVDERAFDIFDRLHDRALSVTEWDDSRSRARIAEASVAAASARDASVEERVETLIEAGSNRLWGGDAEQAIPHLRRAFELAPESVAGLFLADSLVVSSDPLPLSAARGRLHEALDALERARKRRGITDDDAWSFATEALALQPLINELGVEGDRHGWPALLAACRAVAHDLANASRWRVLSDALSALRADALSLEVAQYIVSTFGDTLQWRLLLATRQALAGDPIAALQTTESLDSEGNAEVADFIQSWRAVCKLRTKEPLEAVRILRTLNANPEWTWVTETLVSSLILTGRLPEALAELPSLERHCADRMDQRSTLVSLGWVRVLQGRFREAEQLCADLPDRSDESGLVSGAALVLQGRHEEGVARLAIWIREGAGRIELSDFPVLTAPELRVLAVAQGFEFPRLDELSALAEARFQDLAVRTYPAQTRRVGHFVADDGDPVADLALGMCDALMRVARGEASTAEASLAPLADDEAVLTLQRALRETVAPGVEAVEVIEADGVNAPEESVGADTDEDWSARAEQVVSLVDGGHMDEAREVLRSFLNRDPERAAHDLATASESNYETYAHITDLSRDIASDSDEPAAAAMWEQLRRWTTLRLFLPPSWFADDDDPVATNALFTRYLPEARARMTSLPPVKVTVHEDLEPSGYAVVMGTELLEHQNLPLGRRFAPEGSQPLFEAGDEAPWTEVLPSIVAVPDIPLNGLGELASSSAEEVILRRAEEMYRRWSDALDADRDEGAGSTA